jgi:hypothetical protein
VAARESEVRCVIAASVLAGNNVLDMESKKRLIRLAEPAVLALVAGAVANEVADRWFHSPIPTA